MIKFKRFDLEFFDGAFVNLSFTILQNVYGRRSKNYQLLSTGDLIETDGFVVVAQKYIASELVYEFFEDVDNIKLLDVLKIDRSKHINFMYMGKVLLTEGHGPKREVYIIKNNKLEIFNNEYLALEKEHYLFQLIANKRVIHIAI